MVDCRIHYVKANENTDPQVFKAKALALAPGELLSVQKKISLADWSTRRAFGGRYEVDAVLNGQIAPIGFFELRP